MENGVFQGVDLARPEDEDALYNLLLGLHKENGIFASNEQKARQFIRLATERKGGVIGIIRGETQFEGTVGLILDQWWYTSDWCLSECWCYVHPDYRKFLKNGDMSKRGLPGKKNSGGIGHARRLIEFAKWSAEQLNVPLIMGIMSVANRLEAKMDLYRRQLTPIGELYIHNKPMEIADGRQE